MRTDNQSKWRIINIVSIVTALSCVGVTICGNFFNGAVITTDVFLGVIGSLIGVCTTIIVGFQILNFIEFKEVKGKIEHINKIENEIQKFKSLMSNYSGQIFNVLINTADQEANITKKVNMYMLAITLITEGDPLNNSKSGAMKSATLLACYNKFREILENHHVPADEYKAFEVFRDIKINSKLKDYLKISNLHFEISVKIENLKNK